MADLVTVKIRDLIETQQVMTTDYLVLEKDTGTFKCQARYLKGATGVTPNITIGNTYTLAPGQLATVTKRGNTENPIFDFGIPQGVQGQIGPQGPKGDTPDITPLQTQIDNRFNALTSQQQGSSEVIEARGGYPALKARLDAINDDLIKYNDQTIVTHTTENNFSSISATKNGYLDNILLEGKTLVVDSNNNVVIPGTQGATLKSVGDGVTEIKLNSINENLFNNNKAILETNFDNVNGDQITKLHDKNITYPLVGGFKVRVVGTKVSGSGLLVAEVMYTDNTSEFVNIGQIYTLNANKTVSKIRYSYSAAAIYKNVNLIVSKTGNIVENKSNTKKVLYKDTDGTWKKPTLRQWDSIEKHSDGKYYYHKRSGNIVLNGSENWVIDTTMPDTHSCFKFDVTDSIIDVKCISDKFNSYIRNEMYNKPIEGVIYSTAFYGGNKCVVNILRSKLSSNTVQGFKNWLQSNNVNVVYKLAQEQVFECTPIDLISYDTQTNYSIECGPIYPKTTLKVNSYLGNVVSILKDKVSYLENMLVDGLKLVVAGNMQELAYQLYPQDFVDNYVDMEVIK